MEFIQKNIWLVMIAIVSGVLFIWPSIAKLMTRSKEIGAAAAVLLINRQDAAIIDVRDPQEFKAGHIPNARNIPMAQLDERKKELEKLKSKPVLLVCQTGNRSAQVYANFHKQGFVQAVTLAGGMASWQQAGMPVEKS